MRSVTDSGFIDRPGSMHMECPYVIGRGVWVWGGQESVVRHDPIPPTGWGKKPSPRASPSRVKTGCRFGKMVVVVVVVVVVAVVVVVVVVVVVFVVVVGVVVVVVVLVVVVAVVVVVAGH